jgi:hypothetical protein
MRPRPRTCVHGHIHIIDGMKLKRNVMKRCAAQQTQQHLSLLCTITTTNNNVY